MDINQLIADLQEISQKNSISHYKRGRCADAATALSMLQAENEKLRAELEQVKRERDVTIDCLVKNYSNSWRADYMEKSSRAAFKITKENDICYRP